MGRPGKNYGSEYHLRRVLADSTGREKLDGAIAHAMQLNIRPVRWAAFPKHNTGDRELTGMEFLKDNDAAMTQWVRFWPQRGKQPSWDAVGLVGDGSNDEWLLVEAKANHPEFCSDPCGAGPASRKRIQTALQRTKTYLGVHRHFNWLGTYYQYANRLACLYFLNEVLRMPARLAFVYFMGDTFPDRRTCPASQHQWRELIGAAHLTLGLPERHPLSDRVHDVFLPIG